MSGPPIVGEPAGFLESTIIPAGGSKHDAPKPISGHGKSEAKPKPSEGKKSPLSVYAHELKQYPSIATEAMTAKVEFSDYSYQTLVNTITRHLMIAGEILNSSSLSPGSVTDLHKQFYEAMLLEYHFKKDDLKNVKKMEEIAKQFLQKGGAEVRLALKLAEWEAATLQAATGRELVKKDDKKMRVGTDETEVIFITTKDGAVTGERAVQLGFLDKVRWWKGKKIVTQVNYVVKGGNVLDMDATSNTLLNDALYR